MKKYDQEIVCLHI
jgi:hypothetical protein